MKRRRRSDKFVEPFVVTASDGTKFRCSVAALGRETEPRWMLFDSDGVQYVGPRVEADKSPAAVAQLVSAWWEREKETQASETQPSETLPSETPPAAAE